ncbi:TPA: hypothetical protein RPW15_001505 [Campylobacter fetus subsp. venerealis]|nr:hypothetical protein [Campylobacter fetus subsp. venerealis]HDX6253985.1 hypothetical protein [Campylobacter fetus subsp. venerealis]HDX6258173.1 hypothetical protein [Campylobacter fetus subsp. venerealis]HDX6261832.1 hypothetical protein [Campylobacter fetus subsp. venerealis]HDX6263962.1 hypothetical protein [Campylobacter fetus subsp. venerealis]
MQLDKTQIKEAKELLEKLTAIYTEKAEKEIIKRNREDKLRYEIAQSCEIKNKNGDILANKVKISLLMAIINVMRDKTPSNKFEVLVSDMEDYQEALEKDVDDKLINSYIHICDELDEVTTDIKAVVAETSLLDKQTLDAIGLLAKERYKQIKEDKMLEAGYEVKPPKDKTEINELKEELDNLLQ